VVGFDKIYLTWIEFLNHAEPLVGIPLLAVGAALVLAGWRLWRVIIVINMMVVGVAAGLCMAQLTGTDPDWRWMAGLAVLLGAAGGVFYRLAAPLLGGLAGGFVGYMVLQTLGFYGPVLWLISAIVLAAATGWSYAYRNQVQSVLTSAEGGALFASGIAIMLPEVPILHKFFSSMTSTSPFMIGFYILVPTVVGVMMQQADVNRSTSKEAE